MNIEEIFKELSAHFVEGMMFHDKMSAYFDFLFMEGYAELHKYHFMEETKGYRDVQDFHFRHFGRFIEEKRIEFKSPIPENWLRYTRKDVDTAEKKNGVKAGFEKWLKWERDTHALYGRLYREALDNDELETAEYIKDIIKDVSEEICDAEQEILRLSASGYDMAYIMERQEKLKRKYKKAGG